MLLDKEKTKKVAKLANLPVSVEELDKYSEQLSKILDYIDQLEKVDVKDIEPAYNVSVNQSKMREDEVKRSLHQDETLQNASQSKDGFFVTKGVFEE